jgi:hypothetical protein
MSHIRMRQICLVAHDLDRIQQLCESVFGVEVCYRDPGVGKYGLHNFLIPFGDQFLETVSPQPGHHDTPGGRYLHRRGGDGGYMVIMQVPREAFASYRHRVDDLGIRLVSEPGESERGMGMQLHPKDVPGAIAELRWNEDEDRTDGSWWPAGADWQRVRHTCIADGIRAAEIQTADPTALAVRWGEVLDEPVVADAAGNPSLALQDSELRFVPPRDGRPEGLGGLDIHVTDRERALANAAAAGCLGADDLVTICGMRLRLV